MKPIMLYLLVNISTVGALGAFVLHGTITLHQLPVVAVLSIVLMNGAAFIGVRARRGKN
jgi:hypothetical protein